MRSTSAARRAELAAIAAQDSSRLFDTLSDAAQVVKMLEEAKRLNRSKDWKLLLDRFSEIKKTLVAINIQNKSINDAHKSTIQSSITQIGTIENILEKAVMEEKNPDDPVKINKIASKQIEKIHSILIEIKSSKVSENVI